MRRWLPARREWNWRLSSSDETKVHADWPAVPVVTEPKHLFNDPNIDLIVIPTPNDTHFPLAKAALEAGKHVVVDKPFTVTLSQARELDGAGAKPGSFIVGLSQPALG